jgi:hypothetical protein
MINDESQVFFTVLIFEKSLRARGINFIYFDNPVMICFETRHTSSDHNEQQCKYRMYA